MSPRLAPSVRGSVIFSSSPQDKDNHMPAKVYVRPTVSAPPPANPLLSPQPPIAPLTPPVHVVDLMTPAGSAVFCGLRRGTEGKRVPCPPRTAPRPPLQPPHPLAHHAPNPRV